ncbi:MAG: hypothetical protein A3G34_01385 [Candidatus Lindowbacteria bacterium RIFCSPLOWO2_12_FULL_62_27]|nr:MAG: hypothetical protein A3G34_01385 [Candidatus Lindowbacteria bacterium RIFCSPLOWO2_12_FULL_62_27]OGH61708.1 MAG: hypothetical protein A3I06_16955 [Candidatus Lindowbacteria bacterium RIFCSPLOWO2_02_FULL_62_12]
MPPEVWTAVMAGLGLTVGSFLNVCIHRLPQGVSVVFPRSSCPSCGHTLGAAELVPVLSYLFQRGKCRSCGCRISPRYALVEILTGAIFVFCHRYFFLHGDIASGLAYLYFFSVLVVVVFIDLDHYLILDVVTYPGMAVALILALPGHWPLAAGAPVPRLLESAQGLAVGGGILWLIQFLGMLWYRKQGLAAMGLGDVKLAAFTGAFLGPKHQAYALFISVVIGGVGGMLLMLSGIRKGKEYIAFGPVLAAGAAIAPFYGMEFYEGLMRMIQTLVSLIMERL